MRGYRLQKLGYTQGSILLLIAGTGVSVDRCCVHACLCVHVLAVCAHTCVCMCVGRAHVPSSPSLPSLYLPLYFVVIPLELLPGVEPVLTVSFSPNIPCFPAPFSCSLSLSVAYLKDRRLSGGAGTRHCCSPSHSSAACAPATSSMCIAAGGLHPRVHPGHLSPPPCPTQIGAVTDTSPRKGSCRAYWGEKSLRQALEEAGSGKREGVGCREE